MVTMFSKDLQGQNMQSSKGNQLKWRTDGVWYKADFLGYEGLAEYVVSALLEHSNLAPADYVRYQTEEILYQNKRYLGCKSKNFLKEGDQLITLERLYRNQYGRSLYQAIYQYSEIKDRASFLVSNVEKMTGIKNFGEYLQKMLAIDAVFLNEDRHMHNVAVILDESGKYRLCPYFDQGAALLSDTIGDYPMDKDIIELIPTVESKTLCYHFDEQADAADELYGLNLQLTFTHRDVEDILAEEPYYPEEIKLRVRDIVFQQMRKYRIYFA